MYDMQYACDIDGQTYTIYAKELKTHILVTFFKLNMLALAEFHKAENSWPNAI